MVQNIVKFPEGEIILARIFFIIYASYKFPAGFWRLLSLSSQIEYSFSIYCNP